MLAFVLYTRLNCFIRILSLSCLILLCSVPPVAGQGRDRDYERSRTYSARTRNLVFRQNVKPNWFDENRKFWYRVQIGSDVHEYVLVDAEQGKRSLVFDHDRLGDLLSRELKRKLDVRKRNSRFQYRGDVKECSFRYAGQMDLRLPEQDLVSAIPAGDTGKQWGCPPSRVVRSVTGKNAHPF